MSNTSSLSSKPALNLQNTIVGVGRYGVPNVSVNNARRSQANGEASASPIRRDAGSR